jgi:phosphatidylglycerophosphatase A
MTMKGLAVMVATVAGVGYAPVAPGTFGSAAGLIVWWLLPASNAVHAAAIVAIFIAGTLAATQAERHFAMTDPGAVVIDEVLGMLVTLFLNPVGIGGALLGFLLFRVFDIVKPFPARQFERLPDGLGVMADDGMAGVYANLALRVLLLVGR